MNLFGDNHYFEWLGMIVVASFDRYQNDVILFSSDINYVICVYKNYYTVMLSVMIYNYLFHVDVWCTTGCPCQFLQSLAWNNLS